MAISCAPLTLAQDVGIIGLFSTGRPEYTSYPFHQLCPATNTGFGNADPGRGTGRSGATGLVLPNEANIST
jgi:hypothetical protein